MKSDGGLDSVLSRLFFYLSKKDSPSLHLLNHFILSGSRYVLSKICTPCFWILILTSALLDHASNPCHKIYIF